MLIFLKDLNVNKRAVLLACLLPLSMIAGPLIVEINIFLIICFFLYKKLNEKDFNFIYLKISYCFYLLIFFHLIGFVLLNFSEVSLAKSIFYIRFLFLMLCISYFLQINEKIFIKFTFYIIFFCLLSLIIFGVIQYLEIIYSLSKNNLDNLIFSKLHWRISSLFFDEYVLGSYIIRILPIFFACYFYMSEKLSYKTKKYFFLIIFISHIIILLSSERTSIFMLMFFDALFFLFIKNEKKIKYLIVSFYLGIILIFFMFPNFFPKIEKRLIWDTFGHNGLNIVEVIDKSETISINNYELNFQNIKFFTSVRQKHAEVAIKMFKESPLIGHGIKSFAFKCNDQKYFSGYAGTESSCTTHPHNYYLQFLAETGILIFLVFFFIFIKVALKILIIFKNKKTDNVNQILLLGLFINLLPFMPSGSFFNNWLSSILFWSAGFLLHFNYKNK